jgi:hypothetical protein
MPLTTANCRDAFKNTLRALPAIGDTVDLPEVEPNIHALGDSVRVIVGTLADGVSDNTVDAAFWAWVASVNAWMQALRAWQQLAEATLATGAPVGPPPAPPASLTVDVR